MNAIVILLAIAQVTPCPQAVRATPVETGTATHLSGEQAMEIAENLARSRERYFELFRAKKPALDDRTGTWEIRFEQYKPPFMIDGDFDVQVDRAGNACIQVMLSPYCT